MHERDMVEKVIEFRVRSQRDAILDHACGSDATLRRRLDELLTSHDRASGFLDIPLVDQFPPGDWSGRQPRIELSSSTAATRPAPAGDDREDQAPGTADLCFLQSSSKPGSIGRLGHYEILKVPGTRVTDKSFLGFTRFEFVDLSNTLADDDGLARQAEVLELVAVNLRNTKVTPAGIEAFRKASPGGCP